MEIINKELQRKKAQNTQSLHKNQKKFLTKKEKNEIALKESVVVVAVRTTKASDEEEEEDYDADLNAGGDDDDSGRFELATKAMINSKRSDSNNKDDKEIDTISQMTANNNNNNRFKSKAARRAFEDPEQTRLHASAEDILAKRIEIETKALTEDEVVVRLRRLKQPIKLFGETNEDRRMRLEVATKNIKVMEDDEHLGGQQANERAKLERMYRENGDSLKKKDFDSGGGGGGNNGRSDKNNVYDKNNGSDNNNNNNDSNNNKNNKKKKMNAKEIEELKQKEAEDEAMNEFERAAKRLKKQRDAETDPNAHPIDRVAEHFKGLLKEWAMDIEGTRFETVQQKRQQLANCELAKTHMKPLFKKMKKRDLPNDIERALFLMFEAMKARDYKRATDAYVGVAIGNAAWPIGVTSVGIHDRSAREKISATTQAHAMHDEETRKYLQSVKRLITFSQRAYPTVPSLAFDFNSGANGSDKQALLNAEKTTGLRAQIPALMQLPSTTSNTASINDQGEGRKWESLMRHAYDNVNSKK